MEALEAALGAGIEIRKLKDVPTPPDSRDDSMESDINAQIDSFLQQHDSQFIIDLPHVIAEPDSGRMILCELSLSAACLSHLKSAHHQPRYQALVTRAAR
jgi:hypothetical protein